MHDINRSRDARDVRASASSCHALATLYVEYKFTNLNNDLLASVHIPLVVLHKLIMITLMKHHIGMKI